MKSFAKVLLGIGAIVTVAAVVSKMSDAPLVGSKPIALIGLANSCFLMAIGLLLMEDKK